MSVRQHRNERANPEYLAGVRNFKNWVSHLIPKLPMPGSHPLSSWGFSLALTATMLVRVTDGGMGLRADRGEVPEILH